MRGVPQELPSKMASLMETILLPAFASCLKDPRKEPMVVSSRMSRQDIAKVVSLDTLLSTLCKGTTSVLNQSASVMSHSEEAKHPLIYGLLETTLSMEFTQKTSKFTNPTTMNLAQKVRAAYSGKQMMESLLISTSLSLKNTSLVIHLKLSFPGMIVDLKRQTSIATNLKEKNGAVLLAVPM